jgi:hypothetical protein
MKRQRRNGLIIAAMAAAIAPAVWACGDKLSGLGGGVPFARIHHEALGGQILLFARPDSELGIYNQRAHLRRNLEKSGRTVKLIQNDLDLTGALQSAHTDLILADRQDARAIREKFERDGATHWVVSIVTDNVGSPSSAALPSRCELHTAADQSRDLTKALERLLNERQSSAITSCAADGERS